MGAAALGWATVARSVNAPPVSVAAPASRLAFGMAACPSAAAGRASRRASVAA
jgi:hypothetical protein